jgi:clan AA aspartic protease (TIGR02281 family)
MGRLANSLVLLLAGTALGWWLHGVLDPAPVPGVWEVPQEIAVPSPERLELPPLPARPGGAEAAVARPDSADRTTFFRQLLEQHQFDAAVDFYSDSVQLDEGYPAMLRPVLDRYMNACMTGCGEGVFLALVDSWLDTYYEDIPVLLMLAQYQWQQGYPEEALQVIGRAMTFSYQPWQGQKVRQSLQQLVRSTDEAYGEQERWVELLGFYELLAELALEEPALALRRASLYRLLGEETRARSLLLELQAADDGMDEGLTRAVAAQLSDLSPQPLPEVAVGEAIPLARRGDHFLVEVTLNDRDRLVLMIDTGASLTSLSRYAFERLAGSELQFLGSRMFNTANGLAPGEVYRAASLQLGESRLDEVHLAVLDYDSPSEADGLLGMNVLRNFRFEIDQDSASLNLRPRR